QAKRNSIIEGSPLSSSLIDELLEGESIDDVIKIMLAENVSQRKISRDLGISRSQVSKFVKAEGEGHE
ncbi:ATPase, partial [Shigella flexneri]